MNPFQEAIIDITGIRPVLEDLSSRAFEAEELRGEFETEKVAWTERQEVYERAVESVSNDYRMLARAVEDLDYMNLYEPNKIADVLPVATRRNTIVKLRRLRHENPLAKQGMRLIVRFTLGKGIQWISKNAEIRDVLNEFWYDEANRVLFTDHSSMKEFIDECATDGEKFLAGYEGTVAPYLSLAEVPMEEIDHIIYDPDNRRIPIYYKRKFVEEIYDGTNEHYKTKGKAKTLFYRDYRVSDERLAEIADRVKIPKAKIAVDDNGKDIKIMHIYVNPLWGKSGRRGISELFASREWFRVFKEFMQDRAKINAAATAFSHIRKIKGGPSAVAQFSGKVGGVEMGGTDDSPDDLFRRLTRPVAGAMYDTNEGVDLDWLKTDTGATNAKEDARLLLMVGGAGMGTNIHYFGEGGDANLATAQAMELPMVKNYEDWQKWFEAIGMALFDWVLKLAFGDNIPFESDVQEAIGDIDTRRAGGETEPAGALKLQPGTVDRPATIQIEEPEKKTVWDVISWNFPPIITKDVVKHMTAWAQLTNQVAPGDKVVKIEAIRGALTVLAVPNVDQLMARIEAEEEKLAAERELQKQLMMDNLSNPEGNGTGPDTGGNGKDRSNVPGFVKSQTGGDSDTRRVASGKPPIERNGSVAGGSRPGR